ncbi:hypothetical protein AYI69_g5053 [Smittium culicis]|uniref:Uncharacterized protein n=1 Tax=Smittium culicis TaxID=133412 RepID=A0A1R1Y453_9FUNG|nr:hypothetical protein AYI69_g5758 [Smittium culicis]OMJ23244.1 hypothetical protein AYI69_g5053 [Smittium culicis]
MRDEGERRNSVDFDSLVYLADESVASDEANSSGEGEVQHTDDGEPAKVQHAAAEMLEVQRLVVKRNAVNKDVQRRAAPNKKRRPPPVVVLGAQDKVHQEHADFACYHY